MESNLRYYNRFMANCISKVNTETGEEGLNDAMEMSVDELLNGIYGAIAEKYEIKDGDYETMKATLQKMKTKELMELFGSLTEEAE